MSLRCTVRLGKLREKFKNNRKKSKEDLKMVRKKVKRTTKINSKSLWRKKRRRNKFLCNNSKEMMTESGFLLHKSKGAVLIDNSA